jgi:broad specificity phosphatase PhoE
MSKSRTVVHLLRHGEVHNPEGVLYGRLPDYHLSELGHQMAARVGEWFMPNDIIHVVSSPLERARETARPLAQRLGADVIIDSRVIEAGNFFEGKTFGVGDGALHHPGVWWRLRNPFKPSWGEPYKQIATRMMAAILDARATAEGREIVIVSHQLPVWIARRTAEGRRRYAHDPRRRQCQLASVTSITFSGPDIVGVAYNEPARDLVPVRAKKNFVAGA